MVSIISIGAKLRSVKAHLDHGQFGSWLSGEFGWSERTAQNYMRLAEVFGTKSETVAGLPPTLIYTLAAKSTPNEIREKVIADLEVGREIDCKAVMAKIKQSRPSTLLERDSRISRSVEKARSILGKLPADDADRLLQLLGTPRVLDRLKYERIRSSGSGSTSAV